MTKPKPNAQRGRPKMGLRTAVLLRIAPDLLASFDETRGKTARNDALKQALEDWIARPGEHLADWPGADRLVMPTHKGDVPAPKPLDAGTPVVGTGNQNQDAQFVENNAGSGGGILTGDPLVDALILKLPKKGTVWAAAERATWLKMIEMAFDLAYGVNP